MTEGERETRQCPHCAEDVRLEAKRCPHCRERIGPEAGPTLHRGRPGRQVAGVARALAEYFSISVTLVRLMFIVAAFLNLVGVVAYGLLWLLIPAEPAARSPLELGLGAFGIDGSDGRSLFDRLGQRLRGALRTAPRPPHADDRGPHHQTNNGAA